MKGRIGLNRTIKNGKLELVSELIGGPGDGLLCDCDCEKIRLPKREPRELAIQDNNSAMITMPDLKFHSYKRITNEKLLYVGVSGF